LFAEKPIEISTMNILIIPSWYPWAGNPLRGIFFYEQALYLGQMRPDWKIAIAVWGQRRFTLSLRNPFKTIAVLIDFLVSKSRRKKCFLLPNVIEYHQPTIEWTRRWGQGNIKGMVRSCRKICQRVSSDFGFIDLIHAQVTFPGGWIAMKLNREFNLPYIITEHMGNFPALEFRNKDNTVKEIIAEPLRHARIIASVSPAHAEQIAGWGFPKPLVIPNMIDDDFFKPDSNGKKDTGDFIFFSLSAFKPAKGIDDLLQALAMFLDQSPDRVASRIELRIGGSGEMKKILLSQARQLKIEPWLRWLGPLNRNQVLEAFQGCDCFILPSHQESFSIVLLEALSCGKPVIATRCGGPESMVTPENGILVPRQNPASLAQAMIKMVYSAKNFDSAKIRQRTLEKFSKKNVCKLIDSLYRGSIKKNSQ
jgi:glycosyltransferase involved in cell wall biosynthesis